MKKMLVLAVALAVALPMFANPSLFAAYEAAREAFLQASLKDVKSAASALAAEAAKQKNAEVEKHAKAVAASKDLDGARAAFAPLSDEMIKMRETAKGTRPAVYHCPMVKKSWLQPKGAVGNPYSASMKMCGELKEE